MTYPTVEHIQAETRQLAFLMFQVMTEDQFRRGRCDATYLAEEGAIIPEYTINREEFKGRKAGKGDRGRLVSRHGDPEAIQARWRDFILFLYRAKNRFGTKLKWMTGDNTIAMESLPLAMKRFAAVPAYSNDPFDATRDVSHIYLDITESKLVWRCPHRCHNN